MQTLYTQISSDHRLCSHVRGKHYVCMRLSLAQRIPCFEASSFIGQYSNFCHLVFVPLDQVNRYQGMYSQWFPNKILYWVSKRDIMVYQVNKDDDEDLRVTTFRKQFISDFIIINKH